VSRTAPADQAAYGETLRVVRAAGPPIVFQTEAFPASWQSRGFTFENVDAADEQLILHAFASFTPFYRQIVSQLDGLVTITVSRAGCGPADVMPGMTTTSCMQRTPTGARIVLETNMLHDPVYGRFIIAHEFGHVIDAFGLDDSARHAFATLFSHSKQWKRGACFKITNLADCNREVLADQLAFYATGHPQDIALSSYGDPPLASVEVFERLLRTTYGFRAQPLADQLFATGA
jgi:hypothetical protein